MKGYKGRECKWWHRLFKSSHCAWTKEKDFDADANGSYLTIAEGFTCLACGGKKIEYAPAFFKCTYSKDMHKINKWLEGI